MVDGILASCYASVNHDLAHLVMTPLRLFLWIIERIFGEDNGLQGFAAVTEHIIISTIPTTILRNF